MLERGELDAAIVQVFSHEVRPADVVLFHEPLHWVKHPELSLPETGPMPFLSFDEECFYRRWALDIGQDGGVVLETVFECSGAAGIVAAVTSAMAWRCSPSDICARTCRSSRIACPRPLP